MPMRRNVDIAERAQIIHAAEHVIESRPAHVQIHIRAPITAVTAAAAIMEIQQDVPFVCQVAVENVAQVLVAARLLEDAGRITGAVNKQYGRPGSLVSVLRVETRRQQEFGGYDLPILASGKGDKARFRPTVARKLGLRRGS